MPRRSRSGISTGQIVGLGAGILFILLIAFAMFSLLGGGLGGGGEDRKEKARIVTASDELNLVEYLNNANALRGNAYWVSGRIEEQLKWTPDRGRLISLEVDQTRESAPVPILVPQAFGHVNIEKGAEFTFVVEVGNSGLLIAREVK